MTADLNVWDKLTRLVMFLLFLAYLLAVAVWYLPLIHQNENYRKEILRYDARIERQRQIAKQLHSSIEALNRDPKAIERLVREQLHYGKPGETIIIFDPPVTNAPKASAVR